MDEEKFGTFLKRARKPAGTIKDYVNSIKIFENFLRTHRGGKLLDQATSDDLEDFVAWGMIELANVYRCLWGIRAYYSFTESTEMENKASELMEFIQNETRRLSEFPSVDREGVDKLASVGIKTVNQLLDTSRTHQARQALAAKSGASLDSILELVKLSDLSRLPGIKKVRCRLFYEGGLDTLPKIAALEPEEIQAILQEYTLKTGFDGKAPAISEAKAAVTMARFLPQKIDL